MRFTAIFVAGSLTLSQTAAAAVPPPCQLRADLKGPCFAIHGVLFQANGAPGLRIWRTGTKRILGVVGEDEEAAVPPVLRDHLGPGVRFSADWRLCPLSRERRGWMRFVCMVNVRNVVVSGDGDRAPYWLAQHDR